MDTYEYIYIHEGRKIKFSGISTKDIAIKVISFLSNYGIKKTIADIEPAIINQMKFAPIMDRKKKIIPKFSEAYHASLALFRVAGGKTVDQKELDERQNICKACPLRSQVSYCSGCGGLGKITNALNDVRRLTRQSLVFDSRLKSDFCGVCGCSLPLLLATNKYYLPEDNPIQKKERPAECWMNKK